MTIWTLLLLSMLHFNALAAIHGSEDLYNILGVQRTATTKEIKTAYRRKALDTHPDKNKKIPAEEAAAAFHKVVNAFEVLSDKDSRRRYDQTGQTDSNQQQQRQQNQEQYSWSFTWSRSSRRQRVRLKDKFEVKESQSRVMHIVSLEQLETVIVDDDQNLLERNLLLCFLTPQIEEHVMDEMVYPYPFAAMSSQGVWWEDLLQTTIVRFHRSNKLTEFFDIPTGDKLKAPIFVFGKRGQALTTESAQFWPRLETNDRHAFDQWTWSMIEVEIEFINEHDHPVEVYWIHGTRANWKMKVGPGERIIHTSKLSHEWWVRDARVDTFTGNRYGRGRLTNDSMLKTWKIISDEHRQKLVIPRRKCFDLSGHCPFWKAKGECRKNPTFMEEQCRLTCQHCESDALADDKESLAEGNDEL